MKVKGRANSFVRMLNTLAGKITAFSAVTSDREEENCVLQVLSVHDACWSKER